MTDHRVVGRAIGDLFTFFGKTLDPADTVTYARAVEKYSPEIVQAAVARAKDSRVFLPKPVELRADAEACRAELLATQVYQHCEHCEATPGWVAIVDEAGDRRMSRCSCWLAWLERLGLLPATKQTSGTEGNRTTSAAELAEDARRRLKVVR